MSFWPSPPTTFMDITPLVERLRVDRFRELAGAEAFVKVPLPEAIVNAFVETAILPSVPALRALRVAFHEGNRVDVIVALPSRLLPAITVPLEIEPHVHMGPSPTVRLHLLQGGVAGLLGPLAGAWSDRLPRGVRIDQRVVEIDVRTLLAGRDPWGLLDLLQQARVTTTPSTLWVEVALGVAPPATSTASG